MGPRDLRPLAREASGDGVFGGLSMARGRECTTATSCNESDDKRFNTRSLAPRAAYARTALVIRRCLPYANPAVEA